MENDENDPTVEEDSNPLQIKEDLIQHSIPNRSMKEERVLVISETIDEVRKTKNLKKDYSCNKTENLHSKQNLQCNECDFNTSSSTSIWRHKQAIHQGLRFQCPYCKHKAKRSDHLKSHIKYRHWHKQLNDVTIDVNQYKTHN